MISKKREISSKAQVGLILGIAVGLILILLVFFSVRTALFGKVVEGVDYAAPIAYFPFDNPDDLGEDVAGDHDAVCVDLCPVAAEGREGTSAYYSEPDDSISFDVISFEIEEPITLAGDFTIMFWVKSLEYLWEGRIILDYLNETAIGLSRTETDILMGFFSDGAEVVSAPADDGWTHFSAVRTSGMIRWYIDGEEIPRDSSFPAIPARSYTFDKIGPTFSHLDELKFFDIALTPEQIRASAGLVPSLLLVIPLENTPAACEDKLDNDGDDLVDCAESSCSSFTFCEIPTELTCTDRFDNDGDNFADCRDSDCVDVPCGEGCMCISQDVTRAGTMTTVYTSVETSCEDQIDNDGDHRPDCFDVNCQNAAELDQCLMEGIRFIETEVDSSIFSATEADCADLIDNDRDSSIDCADPDCSTSCAIADADEDSVEDTLDRCPMTSSSDVYSNSGCMIGDVDEDNCVSALEMDTIITALDTYFNPDDPLCEETYTDEITPQDGDLDGDHCISALEMDQIVTNLDSNFDPANPLCSS